MENTILHQMVDTINFVIPNIEKNKASRTDVNIFFSVIRILMLSKRGKELANEIIGNLNDEGIYVNTKTKELIYE